MQYSQLIARIQADIYNNGAELITGDILQGDLLAIISALASAGAGYGGIITPDSSAPASLDQATFYIAVQPGTYSSFGVTVTEPSIVSYGGGATLTFTVSPLGLASAMIANNLTTDDATKALSAAQGVVLEGEISRLDKKSAKLKTKSKAEMVKLANAYIYWISVMGSVNGWHSSSNFELYAVRAKGVKAIYAKVYDTSASEMAIGFFSGSKINRTEAISSACIRSKNGVAEYWITDIPAEAKWITYCNRSASGTGEFVIYYEDEEAHPEHILFIDELLNSDTSAGKLSNNSSYNNRRVVSKSVCSFPRQGMRIFFKIPIGLRAYLWYSSPSGSNVIDTTSSSMYDGDYYDFPKTATHYRIVFASTENDTLPAENVQALVNAGDIAFYYDEQGPNVIDRNAYAEPRAAAVKRNLTGLLDGMDSMFVMAHISDLHGDSIRLINFAKYCNHYGVDAACNSGDSVMYRAENYTSFAQKIMSKYSSVPYLFCIGNHEVNEAGSAVWTQGVFGDNISPLVSSYGYLKEPETPADDCYYYKDFVDKKIRIIALNYYNDATYSGSLGQTQINWFIATISSTPSGYGILVMLHSPEDKVVVAAPYDTFRQKVRVTTYQENGFYVGDRPIMHIVDAFIGRTSYSGSYSDNGTTVTINADFSAITDDTIQFIAYIVGHRHEDWIGYYEHATHKQLSLGITAGIALYGHGSNKAFANQEDLPRGGEGVCQDAFNIYGIDRKHNVVKVARIGADLTFDFVPREYMEIPYAD